MKINNRFIYRLTDRLGTLLVVPLGESEFSLDYDRENEEKLSYKKQLSGKIVFTGDAFKRIMQMENSIYRCDEQTLTIFKECNGIEKMYFVGKISLNESEFNLDKCQVTMKFLEDKSDKCIDDGKNIKLNLFQLIYNRITVKTASFVGVIETKNCHSNSNTQGANDYWCGTGDPYSQNWTLVSYNVNSPDGMHNFVNNTWKREIIEVDCSEVADPDWVLVEDNCGTTGKKKFARGVTLFDCVVTSQTEDENGSYQYTMDCKVLGYDGGTTVIDNGLHFTEVMKEILKGACPNLTLKSDFFQINPENVSAINYVTGKNSTVKDIIVFQKSDVKRPTASGNASKLEITFEDMMEVLLKMFNVKWRIEGNIFRLEHVSYYSKTVGFDVTSPELKKYFIGKRIYSYENSQIPQKEIFKFKEQQGSEWNMEIVYSGCVTNTKKNEVTNLIDEAMTDITFALQNPDKDSKFVEDTGFCLVSTKKIGSEYFINSEKLNGGSRLNNVFSWSALIRDYHYYERPMKTGKVNGVLTQFITTIPTKKGERFAIPYNFCDVDFNPDNFVKTLLGNGIVSSAKHRFKDYFLELELLYESNNDLVPNEAPVLAGAGVYKTYKNIPKTISIQATDADGFITGINIVYPPYQGTLEIVSFSEIKYTPNNGVTGFDIFQIQAVDNFSEVSNIGAFGIEILPENVPPVASDDSYFVWIGETFFQGTSIFSNDHDDFNSFNLETPNVISSQGVSILIYSNGFFTYVPPSGFEGKDTFQYSIKDDLNNISTATVTLKVAYKNKPVAVDDNYQTQKNTILTADGSGIGKAKLTANDYTPDGLVYSYSATAETKATTGGGSVVINADGTFVFTPLADFTGIDSFDYTVLNSNGSDIGTAKISVIPTIYVRLTTNDQTTHGHISDPYYYRTRDYILNFYSDNAGTKPFDMTGLNFKVKIKEATTTTVNGTPSNYVNIYETDFLTGTSTKILDDFTYQENSNESGNEYTMTATITIENGAYQII